MVKKMLSLLLALTMCLSLSLPSFAAENDSYLQEIKQSYVDNCCFYQITDTDYLDSLADDEIIEVFQNINVTKKLLDENLVLDIDKVTEDDIVPVQSTQNARVFDTETRHTLSSSYDNVVVIKKCVAQAGTQFAGTTVYLTFAYLSNEGIADFIINDWANELSLGQTLLEAIADWVVGTVVGAAGLPFDVALAIVTGGANLGSVSMESSFRTALKAIYDNGGRAILTMSTVSRSCAKWSDRYFYTENASRNGLDITSTYSTYSD